MMGVAKWRWVSPNGDECRRGDDIAVIKISPRRGLRHAATSVAVWRQPSPRLCNRPNTVSKASKRLYMYQLKRAGVDQRDLVRIYMSVIRPVLEYAAPVWSTSMPGYLSDKIETIQKRAMRTIFPGMDYDDILASLNVQTLADRRHDICVNYFNKMKNPNHKLHHLLPDVRNVSYLLRSRTQYPLVRARTNRYMNSLIPWCLRNCQ